MEKRIVIIAYHAPPSNATGTFRTLGFIRHLIGMGWQITLVTAKTSAREMKNDELVKKIPPSVRIIRATDLNLFFLWEKVRSGNSTRRTTHSEAGIKNGPMVFSTHGILYTLKELLTTFLKTPDQQIGWFWPAMLRCVMMPKPSIIYSSAPPFTGHLIGVFCKYLWRIPLVCDFRDPWIDNPFRRKRLSFVEQWDTWLERLVFSKADMLIGNTSKISELFGSKGIEIERKTITITNGFDPEDYVEITPFRNYQKSELLLVHAGMLYGARNPIFFLCAIRDLISSKVYPRLRVLLVGPPGQVGSKALEEVIVEMGLSAYVHTHPAVSHAEALSLMKGADALLLLALGTKLQIPAKFFEYLALKKPICAIVEPESATEVIAAQMGGSIYSARNTIKEIRNVLEVIYKDWERGGFDSDCSYYKLAESMRRIKQAELLDMYLLSLINK